MNHLNNGTLLHEGQYRILQKIGQGGFGITYMAEDVMQHSYVAIKEFFYREFCERMPDNSVNVPVAANRATVDRLMMHFIREAETLFNLQHPNIVCVLDYFKENNTAYYVMECIQGESLSERLERTGQPLTETEARNVLSQMKNALSHLHKYGVMHLDIKPSNIMHSQNGQIVLIDFGASKHVLGEDGHTRVSTLIPYTEGYAPLEQMSREMKNLGPWTDIYSLGATLYKLLTNQTPPDPSEILNNSADSFHFPASVSKQLQDQIIWMMEPSRRNRPQTIEEITQYGSRKRPEPAPETTRGNETTRSEETVLVGGQDPSQQQGYQSQPPYPPQQPPYPPQQPVYSSQSEESSSRTWLIAAIAAVVAALVGVLVYVMMHNKPNNEIPLGQLESTVSNVNSNSTTAETKVTQTETKTTPSSSMVNGHEAVDLGLSVKWSTCNVGASSPYEVGTHVDFYNKDSYVWAGWRLPTTSEVQELINNCSKSHSNGGYRFTGPNGNSIFLYSGGYDTPDGVTKNVGVYGDYWTSTSSGSENAYELSWTNSYGPRLNADKKTYRPCVRLVTN